MAPTYYFTVGKGGVGKSTVSALQALNLARNGNKTFLASLDPAHNLQDVFEQPFSESPKEAAPNLSILQIDLEHWKTQYLRKTKDTLKNTYSYQSAFNMGSFFDIIEFSPGLDEYALLLAFENIRNVASDYHYVLLDMPPTALCLRFFALAKNTLTWVEKLLQLRETILKKKDLIDNIKLGNKSVKTDAIKTKLEKLQKDYCELSAFFTSPKVNINLVLNQDPLSLSESQKIEKALQDQSMNQIEYILNKYDERKEMLKTQKWLDGKKVLFYPVADYILIGMENLARYRLSDRAFE